MIISITVASLIFILLVVFCVLSAKKWHWVNTVFLLLCYLAGLAACVGLSNLAHNRTIAHVKVRDAERLAYGNRSDKNGNGIDDSIDTEYVAGPDANGDGVVDNARFAFVNQVDFARKGSPYDLDYSSTCLLGLKKKWDKELYARGRVWNHGAITADGPNRVFTFENPRGESEDRLSLVGQEMFAFYERTIEGELFPEGFVGVVVVASETDDALVLEPEFTVGIGNAELAALPDIERRIADELRRVPDLALNTIASEIGLPSDEALIHINSLISKGMITEFEEGRYRRLFRIALWDRLQPSDEEGVEFVTWTLYEKMPRDRHDVYTRQFDFDPQAEDLSSDQISKFREQLEALMPPSRLRFDVNNADNEKSREARIAYERFMDRITFDGMSIGDIEKWIAQAPNRISGEFSPDPEETFYEFELTDKSDVEYLVNGTSGLSEEGNFNRLGQALDSALHTADGGPVRLQKGTRILIEKNIVEGYDRENGNTIPAFANREKVGEPTDVVFVRKLYDFPLFFKDTQAQIREINRATQLVRADSVIVERSLSTAENETFENEEEKNKLEEDKKNLSNDVALIDNAIESLRNQVSDLEQRIQKLEQEINDKRALQ